MNIVRMQNVSFSYDSQQAPALSGIDLTINQGEWLSILGPSGSGKSTLCGLLSGLLQRMPGSSIQGSIELFGLDCRSSRLTKEALGRVGLVFQDPDSGLIQSHVEDELSFAPENLRVDPDQIKRRIEQALQAVGLERDMKLRKTEQLSGGQKQRVAIASILTMNPALLILDEAAVHLDQVGTHLLYETIQALHRSGHSIVTTSSRWEEEASPDRVIVLDSGRIAACGTPASVRSEHKERLVKLGIERKHVLTSSAFSLAQSAKKHGHMTAVKDESYPSEDVVLNVQGLHYAYKHSEKPILRNVNFQLKDRSFLAVLGSNGAGKTTLGRLLAGLLPYEIGEIDIRGRKLRSMSVKEQAQKVGYIFQNPDHQFVADTVWSECEFGTDDHHKIKFWLEQFDLTGSMQQNPLQLNLFQKRKLNLLTTILTEPDLIVLDEPTAGLNVIEAGLLVKHCSDYADRGHAVVMITHDFQAIQTEATHALWL